MLVAAVYGCYVVYGLIKKAIARAKENPTETKPVAVVVLAFMLATLLLPGGGAHAQSTTITLDMQPFFDSLNTYLPTFVQIFGLIGGIAAALGFARFIIGSVVDALRGGGI